MTIEESLGQWSHHGLPTGRPLGRCSFLWQHIVLCWPWQVWCTKLQEGVSPCQTSPHNVLNLVQSGSLSFQWEKLHHPEEATNPCVLVLVLPETGPETRIWGQIVYLYSYLRKEQWRSREVRQERESSLWRFIYIQQVTTMATWGSDRLGFSGTQNGTHSRVALARKLG